ncbi:MAG: hypothetical protein ACXVZ1_08400 [Gaiellaceae bacterium]
MILVLGCSLGLAMLVTGIVFRRHQPLVEALLISSAVVTVLLALAAFVSIVSLNAWLPRAPMLLLAAFMAAAIADGAVLGTVHYLPHAISDRQLRLTNLTRELIAFEDALYQSSGGYSANLTDFYSNEPEIEAEVRADEFLLSARQRGRDVQMTLRVPATAITKPLSFSFLLHGGRASKVSCVGEDAHGCVGGNWTKSPIET